MSEGKKILMIGPHFKCQGGLATVCRILYEFLISKNYQMDYLASTLEKGFIYRHVFTLFSYIEFIRMILINRYSLIHIHCSVNNSFYRKLFYIVFAQIVGKKVILQIHPERFYYFYKRHSKYLRNIIKRIIQNIEAIIVLSNSIKRKITKILPEERIYVLNNPIISSNFKCKKEKDGRMILFMGWIIAEKGVYDIVEIIPKVIEIFPSAKFIFCGPKETNRIKSICESRNIINNVDIKGWITGQEKINILKQSTILILPSYTEGFPNVLLEAMASCLPVITTPVGAIPEIIKDGINGFLISPGDRESLKEKILILLKNPELRKIIGNNNIKAVKGKYDIKIIGKMLIDIYSKLF